MADKGRFIAPVEFVTIDPEVKWASGSGIEFHAYMPAAPFQCLHICNFKVAQLWE